jgi:lycopene cyclase-like protein
MTMLDALVIGKGPAGLAAAAEFADRGLSVGVAGPPGTRWPALYGAWADEVEGVDCPDVVQNRWTEVTVDAGGGARGVGRAYVRLDNAALAGWLSGRCGRLGVRWIDGQVTEVAHGGASSTAAVEGAAPVEARVVVDASGHRSPFVRRDAQPEPAYQTAVGWRLETETHPWAADRAVLMDWSDGHLPAGERGGVPTFLYAFPLGGGRVFVEETALAARPAAPHDRLRGRLEQRLRALGIDAAARVGGEERVWIPMGGALPPAQRTIGFGAAAGMVHPTTGYSVVRSLKAAPALADAVAKGLGDGGSAERAAKAAWGAVWPADRRRRHALYRFGLEVLLGLDARETREFFGAFFALPARDWAGYLADALPARDLAGVMARFFAAAPPALRKKLAAGAMSPAGRELAAAMLPFTLGFG